MQLTLDKRFQKRLKGQFEKYEFMVGVLSDSQHKVPKPKSSGLGSYAGGKVRKSSTKDAGVTVSQVSEENRNRLGFNYLTKPFEKRSSAIIQFTNRFFKVITGASQPKRLENLLQAIVRNPILRGEYGVESASTKKTKGFTRPMIDTAQLFKALTAKVVRRV